MNHYVYIVECSDKTLYTGWTNNVEKRIREHNSGRNGARYTRGRRPVKLVYTETCAGLSDALKREAEIKKLSRRGKLALGYARISLSLPHTQPSGYE
jgi:putative endonuclease